MPESAGTVNLAVEVSANPAENAPIVVKYRVSGGTAMAGEDYVPLTNGILVFTTMTVEDHSTVHTRMFAPAIGILEDPATGSASGAMGAYLVHNGLVEVGPLTEIVVEQGYEIGRPARILVQIESDDDAIQEVKVGGQCVMVVRGTLTF